MKAFVLNLAQPTIVVKFLVSGLLTAVFYFSILYILTDVVGIWYLTSSVVTFVFSAFVNFTLQKWWTFRSLEASFIKRQLSLYTMLAVGNIFINTALMYFLTDTLGVWYILSQIIAASLIAMVNFFLYRFYIFYKKS